MVMNDDMCPCTRKVERNGTPDPARAPGYQSSLTLK